MSRTSLMRLRRCLPAIVILLRYPLTRSVSLICSLAIAVIPIIEFIGVLISWDTLDKNSLLALFARYALLASYSNLFFCISSCLTKTSIFLIVIVTVFVTPCSLSAGITDTRHHSYFPLSDFLLYLHSTHSPESSLCFILLISRFLTAISWHAGSIVPSSSFSISLSVNLSIVPKVLHVGYIIAYSSVSSTM